MTDGNDFVYNMDGLTKRELFAAMAMQGLMASKELDYGTYAEPSDPLPWVMQESVRAADALIAELNKEQGV